MPDRKPVMEDVDVLLEKDGAGLELEDASLEGRADGAGDEGDERDQATHEDGAREEGAEEQPEEVVHARMGSSRHAERRSPRNPSALGRGNDRG